MAAGLVFSAISTVLTEFYGLVKKFGFRYGACFNSFNYFFYLVINLLLLISLKWLEYVHYLPQNLLTSQYGGDQVLS